MSTALPSTGPVVLINAVSCRAGGGINDLVQTLPRLRERLAADGIAVRTWVVQPGWEALQEAGVSVDGVELVRITSPFGRMRWEFVTLPRIVRAAENAVVFPFSNFIFRSLGVPQVTVLRSQTFFSREYALGSRRGLYQRMRLAVGRRYSASTIRNAAAVFCISETQRQDIIRTFGPIGERVQTSHLGIAPPSNCGGAGSCSKGERMSRLPEGIRASLAAVAGRTVLLNVSNYYSQKNFKTLFTGVERLAMTHKSIVLVMTAGVVGYTGAADSLAREEVEAAARLADRGLLIDLGPVPKAVVESLLALADVFVFPSSLESFGHPLLEAMQSGLPVVASDTAIHREVCGDAVRFHQTLDADDLARAVRDVLDDSTTRNELVERGKRRVAQFSWDAHVDDLVRAIHAARGCAAL